MQSTEQLVALLRQRHITIWVQDGNLHYHAPTGAVTAVDLLTLRSRKGALIEHLIQAKARLDNLLRKAEVDSIDLDSNINLPYRELLRINKPWELRQTHIDYALKKIEYLVGLADSQSIGCERCGLKCPSCGESERVSRFAAFSFHIVVRIRLPQCLCAKHGAVFAQAPSLKLETNSALDQPRCTDVWQDRLKESLRSILRTRSSQRTYCFSARMVRPIVDLVRQPLIDRMLRPASTQDSPTQLPFDLNPPYRTYQCLAAHPLGIIGAASDLRPLLASEYINLSCRRASVNGGVGLTIVPWRPIGHFVARGCCDLQEIDGCVSFDIRNSRRITQWIIRMLESQWYVLVHVNEYYIPKTSAFLLREDFAHDCLIVGCDGTRRTFQVATYSANGEYELTDVPFTSMAMALVLRGSKLFLADMICFDPCAVAVRPKRDLRFDCDVPAASTHLRNYLQSRPPESAIIFRDNFVYAGDRVMAHAYPRDSYLYGVEAFHNAVLHFRTCAEAHRRIDMRDCRALMESKRIMLSNIDCWTRLLSTRDERQLADYDHITQWARKLHGLCYIYNTEARKNHRDLCNHLGNWPYIRSIEQEILGHCLSKMVKA